MKDVLFILSPNWLWSLPLVHKSNVADTGLNVLYSLGGERD